MTDKEAADAFLKALADRFKNKIDKSGYYLSYSGGKDSHLIFWLLKEYMQDDEIPVIGVNTGMEIPEIRDRIIRNADVVLHPVMHREEVKKRFGIPCFSKQQDEYIFRYQTGSRTENTMKVINQQNPIINLNNTAHNLLLSGHLHKVSNKCCLYSKKKPLHTWQKKHNKKPIIAVRKAESINRRNYHACLKSNGDFTPLFDWTDAMIDLVYAVYEIPIPEVYQYLNRTGCAGCPYGRHIETELSLLPELQRKSSIKYFKESYDVLGVDYTNIQSTLYGEWL